MNIKFIDKIETCAKILHFILANTISNIYE